MQHGADVRLLVQRAHEVQHARVLADGAGVLAVGCSRVRPARSAVCQAGLSSVQFTASPANSACTALGTPRAQQGQPAASSAGD